MSESWDIVYPDGSGEAPILLAARAPGQVAAQPDPSGASVFRGAASGNENFDPVTGRFSGKGLKKLKVVAQTLQEGAQPLQTGVALGIAADVWDRRTALVRDAARTMEELGVDELRGFLDGKVVDVNAIDIASFEADVRWQRMADLADVLDAQIKTKQPVYMVAPNSWVKRIFLGLTPEEGLHLVKTLEGRGWDAADIRTHVVKKIKNEALRGQLDQMYGEDKPVPKKEEQQ